MRTTVDIDQDLLDRMRKQADREGRSFRDELNRTIRSGLAAETLRDLGPFVMPTYDMGGPRPGVDLAKAHSLAFALEDEETLRKMRQREALE
jgi:hypothetical protein